MLLIKHCFQSALGYDLDSKDIMRDSCLSPWANSLKKWMKNKECKNGEPKEDDSKDIKNILDYIKHYKRVCIYVDGREKI